MSSWTAVTPEAIPDQLASWLATAPGVLRVAVDGPPCAAPAELAAALAAPLQLRGRPTAHIAASSFWRDASLRLEHGREDAESYRTWLDAAALRREVLDAALTSSTYLPSLRDPVTNRSTRATPRSVDAGLVLIVSGAFLLGGQLPFDRTVHLAQSASTRARRTPPHEAWTLPAFDAYDSDVRPAERAHVVVKLDDPRRPAIRWTTAG